eukprot:1298-Heterococcus_DN1.PRE.1
MKLRALLEALHTAGAVARCKQALQRLCHIGTAQRAAKLTSLHTAARELCTEARQQQQQQQQQQQKSVSTVEDRKVPVDTSSHMCTFHKH